MGILYLAAYLRTKFDLRIRLVNQKVENYTTQELAQEAIKFEPDVVGFTVMTPAAHQVGELTRAIRQALPKTLILLGGPHTSAFEEKIFDQAEVDAAVVGEGELAFEAILNAYLDSGDFSEIPGLMWRADDDSVVTNSGQMPLIEDLDTLPMPAYDLIDVPAYWKLQSMPPVARRKYLSLVSSRGCPYQCMWCHKIFGKRFRGHSAERIVDEIEYFTKKYHIDDIEFLDDIFNMDRRRVIDVSELVRKRGLKIKLALPNAVRTDILTQDVVDALADLNLYWCSFALETGSSRLQEFTGKRLNIPKFVSGVEMCVKKGIFANGFAMLGFPTETEEEMQLTIDTMGNSRLHTASFFTVTPFPNTRLYQLVQEQWPERLRNLQYSDTNFATIKVNLSDHPDDVLYGYQRKANRQFFLNPNRIYRIVRDYPQPLLLPYYLPIFLQRATKGFLKRDSQA
ncbi:MAG: B12-binding domain-containing radical SAM protein [Phycisphaerae bacterium]|nr:B12-binding domain-containing radical SAM protein [Phycisphaerae bacterium]